MSTVTYQHQPAIHKTRGAVPLAGTSHVYTVTKLLWPEQVEAAIARELIGYTLHVCCGMSQLGRVRFDLNPDVRPAIRGDAARLPFASQSFDTVLCDPPYNGKLQWNHDLLCELARVARKRIIFQHWYMVTDKHGRYKKDHSFRLTALWAWAPKTYFGRVNAISILDRIGDDDCPQPRLLFGGLAD